MLTGTLIASCLLLILSETNGSQDADKTVVSGKITSFERYKRLFLEHRHLQLEAVKSLQAFDDNTRKYKLVNVMLQKLFAVINDAKQNLTQWGFVPGVDPFPENETIREAFSKIVENTAMFGDLVLRLPDVVHDLYDKNKEWNALMGWSVWFSGESKVFDGGSEKLLNLMSQEMNLIPKEEDYINPFSAESKQMKDRAMKEMVDYAKSKVKPKSTKKKKEKKRGPRLSGASHTEL